MKLIKYLILIFILLIISVICYKYYDPNDKVILFFNNQKIVFSNSQKNKTINLTTLSSEKNLTIKSIRNTEEIKIDGKKIFLIKNYGKPNIDRNSTIKISIKYKDSSEYQDYTINLLPTDFPEFVVEGESKTPGDFYLTTYTTDAKYIYKLNNQGKVIFYSAVDSYPFLFKKETIGNKIYYTYIDNDEEINKDSNNSKDKKIKTIYILDQNYNLINTFTIGDNYLINPHDYIMLDLNWFILCYQDTSKKRSNGDNIIIAEIKNGKTLWKYTYEDYSNEYDYIDNLHFNSFKLDDDNNLLVSFRDTSEILKINRKTGKIMWILNGYHNMFDYNIFENQHAIEKYKDKYIVYNNNFCNKTLYDAANNDIDSVQSSIVEFKIDEENKIITEVNEYRLPVLSGIYSNAYPTGDEIFVISYGAFNRKIYPDNPNFEERNIETEEVFFSFKYLTNGYVYRVYKY